MTNPWDARNDPVNEDVDSVYICTDPRLNEKDEVTHYEVTLHLSKDRSVALQDQEAREFSEAISEAAARAEYDASVLRQTRSISDLKTAYAIVSSLRADRAPVGSWGGVTFRDGVGLVNKDGAEEDMDFRPFVSIFLDDKEWAQWDVDDAHVAASQVADGRIVARLDTAYLKKLKEVVGVNEDVATSVIATLGEHRR